MLEKLRGLWSKPLVQIIIWIVLIQILGALMSRISMPGPWYANLNRSSLTPSDWVFPVAWITLYCFIAIYGWSIWHYYETTTTVKHVFIAQLLLNYSWPIVFFKFHAVSLALLINVIIIILNVYLVIQSLRQKVMTWFLLIPYIMWLLFAYYLTDYILRHL